MEFFVATFEELPATFEVEFGELSASFAAQFESDDKEFTADFGEFQYVFEMPEGILPYSGSYTVTPKTVAQELETKDRLMFEDTQINAIPYYEVSNADGQTVFIASEL